VKLSKTQQELFADLQQAAGEMVAVAHFSGCIDGSTADARDNLERILKKCRAAAVIEAKGER